jgi:putative ABC transport system substrate-binding protein
VFQVGADPIKLGLVDSLNRPGGNVTGATMMASDLGSKRLELLRELVPQATSFVALINPATPTAQSQMRDLKQASDTLGLRVNVVNASAEAELEPAFSSMKDLRGDALLIGADPFFNGLSTKIAALTLRHQIPAIYQFRAFTAAGGLLSYGGSITDAYHQAGVYAARVLKGDSPADLPVQQSTKVELIVNLKTAKALGVTVPLTLLGRADEIIE